MDSLKNFLVFADTTLLRCIQIIDQNGGQIAIVVDENSRVLGTLTDGDIRRGLLRGITLQHPATAVMNSKPVLGRPHESPQELQVRMRALKIRQIPVVDDSNQLIRLEVLADGTSCQKRENSVVLMAGGQGTRLRPLTEHFPKPLLTVGDRPILETTVTNLIEQGFQHFYLSVNYKAEMIENYFGDGSQWGVKIEYLREDKALGTAGPLSLIPEKPAHSLLVMNGDLLTKVNFGFMLDFHHDHKSAITMGVREYDLKVPYGVVNLEKERVLRIDEKPVQNFFVNAGIYVIKPEALSLIKKGEPYDMPVLIETLIQKKENVVAFPIREYWLDIGRIADFERANSEFGWIFGR